MTTLLEAALDYAARGLHLFPLFGVRLTAGGVRCACGKACGRDAGKHPMTTKGLLDATTDCGMVQRWWTSAPNANLGLACEPSRLLVIDVDRKPDRDGFESLRDLAAALGPLPATITAISGSEGEHYYFAAPAGVAIANSAGALGPGLDVRGAGGYVVAPPSVHITGRRYEWDLAAGLDDLPFAPLPSAWVTRLQQPHGSPAGEGRLDVGAVLAGVPEGQRNDALFRFASKLRGADIPYAAARDLVLRAAANCTPALPEREALAVLASAYRRYAPRRTEHPPRQPLFVVEVP
jgi:hypothetical protein